MIHGRRHESKELRESAEPGTSTGRELSKELRESAEPWIFFTDIGVFVSQIISLKQKYFEVLELKKEKSS